MKTTQRTFLDYLGAPHTHFIIPVYQRVYTWSDKQCATLWRDCAHAGEAQSEHFIGTVLYSPDPELTSAQTQAIDIIDGQQRTATISLLIAALADYLEEQGMVLEDGTDAAELRARFLLADGRNPEEASRKEKLTLSRLDRATMTAVLNHTDLPEEDDLSKNVVSNYQRFKSYLQAESDAETIWRGLKQLTIIVAEVEESDCPQTVFESLNSKGMPLTTADLARNLLFSDVEYEEQERLYDQYWKPIENLFADDDDNATSMNAALRGWLAVKAPHLRSRASDDVYDALKAFLPNREPLRYRIVAARIQRLLRDVSRPFPVEGSANRRYAHDLGNRRKNKGAARRSKPLRGMIAPACGWQNTRKQKPRPLLAASPRTPACATPDRRSSA